MFSKNSAHHSTMKQTEDQCADMLTKTLNNPQLSILRSKVMVEDVSVINTNETFGGSINPEQITGTTIP